MPRTSENNLLKFSDIFLLPQITAPYSYDRHSALEFISEYTDLAGLPQLRFQVEKFILTNLAPTSQNSNFYLL